MLSMHGFMKMKTKAPIIKALRSTALMRPTRSTLRARSYPCASLSLDEVRGDIADLGWSECPLGSVETVPDGSPAAIGEMAIVPVDSEISPAAAASTSTPAATRVRRRRNRKALVATPAEKALVAVAGGGAGKKRRGRRRQITAIA